MALNKLTTFNNFLLNNKTVGQTIFKNTFWITLSAGINKSLKAILIIFVARILGAGEYGKFSFALAFVSLFVIFFDLGLSGIVTREFAREKEKDKEFLSIISLKILLGASALILIFISSFFITSDFEILRVIWILAIFSFLSNFSEIIYAFFRARQKMEYESWATILDAFLVVGICLFIIFNYPSITNLSYAYLFSTLISLFCLLVFFHFRFFAFKILWRLSIYKKFLAMSWPIALTVLLGTICVYIDSIMMGYLGQIIETGWYSAAYRIAIFTTVPSTIIATSFYPALSKIFKESKMQLQKIWNYYIDSMIALAVPLIVGGLVLAPKIINFAYGGDFLPSILAFQILIIMAGMLYFSSPFMHILVVSNQQRKIFWITAAGAVINIILNLILIPRFSLYGAAISTVITYFVILVLFIYFTIKFTTISPWNMNLFLNTIIVGFSSIIMYFVLSWQKIFDLNLFYLFFIGIFIYFLFYFGLKIIKKNVLGVSYIC